MTIRFSKNLPQSLYFPMGTTPGGQQPSQYGDKIDDWYTVQAEGGAEDRLYASRFLSALIQAAPTPHLLITKAETDGRTRWDVQAAVEGEWVEVAPPVGPPAANVQEAAPPVGPPAPPVQEAAPPVGPPAPPVQEAAPPVGPPAPPVGPPADAIGLATECYQWALQVERNLPDTQVGTVDVSALAHTFYIQRTRAGAVGPSPAYQAPALAQATHGPEELPGPPKVHPPTELAVDMANWPTAPPPGDAHAPAVELTKGLIDFRRECGTLKAQLELKTHGHELYYKVLAAHGLAKASSLTDESKGAPVLRGLREALAAL